MILYLPPTPESVPSTVTPVPPVTASLGCSLDQVETVPVQDTAFTFSASPDDPENPGALASVTTSDYPVAFEIHGFGVSQTEVTLITTLVGIAAIVVYRIRNRHRKHDPHRNTRGNTQ